MLRIMCYFIRRPGNSFTVARHHPPFDDKTAINYSLAHVIIGGQNVGHKKHARRGYPAQGQSKASCNCFLRD